MSDTRTLFAAILPAILFVAPAIAAETAGEQRITLGTQLEPPGLDPTSSASAAIGEVTFPTVYEGLIHLGPNGVIEPALAVSWETTSDGSGYIFRLRPNVRFHDGTPFDAAAVKFSLERAAAPGSPNPDKQFFGCIDHVETPDPMTAAVRLKHPCSSLFEAFGWSAGAILSPISAATDASHPIGTGPFRFSEWRRGDAMTLVRNDDYWGERARLTQVQYRFIADPNAALDALLTGDVTGFAAFPAPESMARLARDPRFHVSIGPSEGKTILALNERAPPFNDVRVRQALSYGVDRRAIIDAAMFGYGTPIGSHYTPLDPGYIDLSGRYPYDPAKARALLEAAGYGGGMTVTLKIPPLSYARRSGEIIAAELASIGVKVQIIQLEWVAWLGQVYGKHDFDMTIVAHVEPMDYAIYDRPDYYFGYRSSAFDALLQKLDATPDLALRLPLLGDVQRMLAEDAANVFLFDFPRLSVWDSRLQDIEYQTPAQSIDLVRAHFDGETIGRAASWSAGRYRPIWILVGLIGATGCAWLVSSVGMAYAGRRLAVFVVTLLGASLIDFAVIQLTPGDPARFMLGMNPDPAALAALHTSLGLDLPILGRYLAWLSGLIRGDLGTSWTYHVPVGSLILQRLAVSLPLTLYALLLSTVMAITGGLAAVAWRGRRFGEAIDLMTRLGVAIPNFWFGLILVSIFGVALHWVSAGGFPGWDAGPRAAVAALTLPAIALALPQAAILARVLRADLIESLSQDYIRTARAKGLSRRQSLLRHALPNSLPSVFAILGLQFSFLLAGGVLIENVFFLPGLGRLVFEAISQRDLVVVQGTAIVLVAEVVAVTFLADLATVSLDPRRRPG